MRDEGRGTKLVIYKCIANTGFSLIPHPSPRSVSVAVGVGVASALAEASPLAILHPSSPIKQ
jgi:hypothetical protein